MPTYKCKNPPIHTPHNRHRFGSRSFLPCGIAKAHGCWARFGYRLVLGPLFWEGPHPRALLYI
jgi:hypothetical protein